MTHHVHPKPFHHRVRAAVLLVTLAAIAVSCGGSSDAADSDGVVIRDISVDTVDGSDITADEPADDSSSTTDEPAGDEEGGDGDSEPAETTTTLPQAEELTPQQELFQAIEVFQSCMDAEGISFIGVPDPSLGDDAPQNQQAYIDTLILCATRSDIQNKIAAANAAQADLTPEEVEEQNRSFLAVRECLVGRGWIIPEPVPNENGLLFGGIQQSQQWEPPAGETLIDSDDIAECVADAGIEQDG